MNRTPHAANAWLRRLALIAAVPAALASLAMATGTAGASTNQVAIIQDDQALQSNPGATVQQFKELGAQEIRVLLFWYQVAPNPNSAKAPSGFAASNPNAKGYDWTTYDNIVTSAQAAGLKVDLDITGAPPKWAQGKGVPAKALKDHYGWDPNAKDYGQFVAAVAKRYDGTFTPTGATSALPKVATFSLWNEPNFGQNLGPQAVGATSKSYGSLVAPGYYRNLLAAAYPQVKKYDPSATLLVGEIAGQGAFGVKNGKHPQGLPGNYAITGPIPWLQTLYCVNSSYQRLTGTAAKMADCPATAAAAKKFKSQNPALFKASGFSSHPYASNYAPTQSAGIGNRLGTELKKLTGHYGAARTWPLYSTEYGYITSPPQTNNKGHHYPSPAKAAIYLNQAEYLSYKNPNVKSFTQYLLEDPLDQRAEKIGLFSSGLLFSNGMPKPGFDAWRLPIWINGENNQTGNLTASSATVWGAARPAIYGATTSAGAQTLQLVFTPTGSTTATTLATVSVSKTTGYFTHKVTFPSSGTLRLEYTYPSDEIDLPVGVAGATVFSRSVKVTR
jgi:hypothetical protein